MARTFAADPQKAAPLLLSVGLTITLLGLSATATPASADAAATSLSVASSPSESMATMAASVLLLLLPLAALLRFVDVLLLSRDETLSDNALRALEIGGRLRSGHLLRRRFRFSTRPQTLAALNAQLLRDELLRGTGASEPAPSCAQAATSCTQPATPSTQAATSCTQPAIPSTQPATSSTQPATPSTQPATSCTQAATHAPRPNARHAALPHAALAAAAWRGAAHQPLRAALACHVRPSATAQLLPSGAIPGGRWQPLGGRRRRRRRRRRHRVT